MFVTIEASVPVTTLSMLSTSELTRFMISPVLVPVKKFSGIRCKMGDQARANVAHDALTDDRVEIALEHADSS